MRSLITRLLHDTSGATAIEYGLLLGVIAMSIVLGAQAFANQMVVLYQIVSITTTSSTNSASGN